MSQGTPFDLSAVFEVDDYMYFYGDDLTDERSEAEVAKMVGYSGQPLTGDSRGMVIVARKA
jgi:hypothetical protein